MLLLFEEVISYQALITTNSQTCNKVRMDILPLPAAQFHLLLHFHQCPCLEVREKQVLPETWPVLPRRTQTSSCSITSLNCMLTSGPLSTWESANIIGTNEHLDGHLEVRVSNLLPGLQELMSQGEGWSKWGMNCRTKENGKACRGHLEAWKLPNHQF